MYKSAFLFIVISFSSCGLRYNEKTRAHSYYSDVDIFNMRGICLLKGDKPIPPCFEVDSIGLNKVRITTWYRKIGSSSLDYPNEDKCWFTNFSVYADTVALLVYKYFGNETLISLEYLNDSSKSKLKAATIMVAEIRRIGPGRVSRHAGDPAVINVLDISPATIVDRQAFVRQIRAANINFFQPPRDPAFHLEIRQPGH